MLLHEIMKYHDLELVAGLELDQTVTRKSFKRFKTDPYFHDPRVDWWFGDAAKSVTVLPESYWGSFDLVLAIGMWLIEIGMWLGDAETGEAICSGVGTHGTAIPNRTR